MITQRCIVCTWCLVFGISVVFLLTTILVQQAILVDTSNIASHVERWLDGHTAESVTPPSLKLPPDEEDPRSFPPIAHPHTQLYLNGVRLYYKERFFRYDNRTGPLLSDRCPHKKAQPEIFPYRIGSPSNRSRFLLTPKQRFQARSDCALIHFARAADHLPIVALASAPGSGNTWLRHLIQQLTGLYSGAVYYDQALFKQGFLGEGRADASVVVIKTHEHWNCSLGHARTFPCPRYDKAIVIVRDPHHAILAEFNRYNSKSHVGGLDKSLFNSEQWHMTSRILARRWYETFEVWSHFRNYRDLSGCVLFVSFRRLQTALREELVRIGEFLGVRAGFLRGKHLDCVVHNSKGNFKRSGVYKPSLGIFSAEVNGTIAAYKKRVNAILKYLGENISV